MSDLRADNNLDLCIHGADPPCVCACPLGLDIRSFIQKLQRGNFDAAYRLYRNAALFPDLAWRLCDQRCEAACLRSSKLRTQDDAAVSLRLLERACVENADREERFVYNIPAKGKRVAIVGSNLAGMACALKLASTRYQVAVYEKDSAVGGSIAARLDEGLYAAEIERQFAGITYELHLGAVVTDLAHLVFDAVFVAAEAVVAGADPDVDPRVFIVNPKLTPLEEIRAGIEAYQDIEWFLKTGSRRTGAAQAAPPDRTVFDFLIPGIGSAAAILPTLDGAYAPKEAVAEAKRCLLCDCDRCLESCELLSHFNTYPRRLAEEVDITMNPSPNMYGRAAVREINLCNLCGHCRQVCPVGVDVGDYLLKVRQDMFRDGSMREVFYDYWLRDLDFADSDEAALTLEPAPEAGVVFFPGCQAAGSDPRYVSETFARLRELIPGIGLLLRCCGVPALWSGDLQLFAEKTAHIAALWEDLGKPELLTLCPSCTQTLRRSLPQIPCRTVFEVFDEKGGQALLRTPKNTPAGQFALFDPCASSADPAQQQAVRNLAASLGCELSELPSSQGKAQCCGWGGQPFTADAAYLRKLAERRATQSGLPYLTYCTNCRDILAGTGKECLHVLDLLLNLDGTDAGARRSPTISERRDNRKALQAELVSRYLPREETLYAPGVATTADPSEQQLRLIIDKELAQRMNADLILEQDIRELIVHCESTGRKLEEAGTGRFTGHLKRGYVTYWAEYEPLDDLSGAGGASDTACVRGTYYIHCAYSHRMVLEESS